MSNDDLQTRRIQRGSVSFNVVVDRNDAYIQDSWTNYESAKWENWSFDMLDAHVSADTTFLDVGSWLGFMSLHVAGRAKRVIAYEADPIAFASVTRNFKANPDWKHIETVNAFVSDQSGTQRVSSLHRGNNSGTTGLVDLGGDSWEVPSIDFAAEIDAIPADAPLFIKMDIEGAEYRVLKCCGEKLARRPNTHLMLSLHPTILAQTVPGHSLIAKVKRRAKLFGHHRSLLRILRGFPQIITPVPRPVTPPSLGSEILLTGSLIPEHRELLFVNK